MRDCKTEPTRGSFDGHHIESARPVPQSVATEVGGYSSDQRGLFRVIDGAKSSPKISARTSLDLDKDQLTTATHHQVQLPGRPSPIAVPQSVASNEQPQQGNPLSKSTKRAALQDTGLSVATP